jgi:hypothetical protein
VWYLIGAILLPVGADRTMKLLAAFPSICAEKRIPINEGGEGCRLDLGMGVRLSVPAQSGQGLIQAVESDRPTLARGGKRCPQVDSRRFGRGTWTADGFAG